MSTPLLSVEGLEVVAGSRPVVCGVSFHVGRGETVALVGESGSGKSTIALTVARLLPPSLRVVSGSVRFKGRDLLRIPEREMLGYRGRRIGLIFQDPLAALNPIMTVGRQLAEAVQRHSDLRRQALRERSLELLRRVGFPEPERFLESYPHQLSGGQRQRVVIAIALAGGPELLIADEPTPALDPSLQDQILELLKGLQKEGELGLLFITHDLRLVERIADRTVVLERGQVVERLERRGGRLFRNPGHPYTQKLLAALPDPKRGRSLPPPSERRLLEVRGLRVWYPIRRGLLKRTVGYVKAVDGVDLVVREGETVALVGPSGCGKTTLGRAIVGLLPKTGGEILFEGKPIEEIPRKERCRKIQMVFQDPFSSLDPRMVVGEAVAEGLRALYPQLSKEERRERVAALLRQVGLPPAAAERYPHQFSGGERQRICIARALAVRPRLIVCDEPTSALDVSIQREIIELLIRLQREMGIGYLFITHDHALAREIAHRIVALI